MENYKEFTGKSLDEAMAAACDYYGLERGKLEIEILSDAKSGIFGLVGAKKATVRARKANIDTLNLKAGAEDGGKKAQSKNSPKPHREKPARGENPAPKAESAPDAEKPAASAPQQEVAPEAAPKAEAKPRPQRKARPEGRQGDYPENRSEGRPESRAEERPKGRHDKRQGEKSRDREQNKDEKSARPARPERSERSRPARPKQERPKQERPGQERPRQERFDKPTHEADGIEDKFPEVPLDSMDPALLEAEVLSAVDAMTRHIVGETDKEFEISGGKARVRIDSGEDSGLLIGRDGQTLSALQYLASCIVSRRLGASVRVQIDTGDYRSRQLEKLRAMALEMADKVRENGRPQSTRPMSAYLRRVVHMALQEDPDVQTHSKGEGSLKRVVIVAKKK